MYVSNLRLCALILQTAIVEVPEEHMGSVVELLGKRRGQMFDMQGVGYAKLLFTLLIFLTFQNIKEKRQHKLAGLLV